MYKIETHLHTMHVSKCGWMTAQELIAGYKAAGYDAVIVTDHYNRTTFDYLGIDTTAPGNKVGPFLDGFHRMEELGEKEGIRVFKGAELRFDESENDYLLFGYRDDLLAEPEEIFRMGIAGFSPIARGQGAILVQAHPYRKKCTPAIACYLDGVETRNCNPRHENNNALAEAYAEQFGLLTLAGSDCHRPEDVAVAGILSAELPGDSFGMARLIRSRRYTLMGG
ncbi:MAG: PHP-associated domain-containing protein [Firmicutes bacterium]|nr:PHP-associated domain-containing protein [Bacillota bacterium]